jgi:hypothetical protein
MDALYQLSYCGVVVNVCAYGAYGAFRILTCSGLKATFFICDDFFIGSLENGNVWRVSFRCSRGNGEGADRLIIC